MACYQRRRSDGEVRRWDRYTGKWYSVPNDEPETRQRPTNEGMILAIVDEFQDGPLTISTLKLSDLASQ